MYLCGKKNIRLFVNHIWYYMPTEMFELASKEDLISEMEEGLNSPEIKIVFTDPKISSVAAPKLINNKYYAVLRYGCVM